MQRARTAKYVGIWLLSAALAAAFLIAGLPKLIGGRSWVQVFGMLGYPDWIRMVVGLVETVGAVLLLVPGLAVFAATGLLILMVGATYAQLNGPLPANAVVPATLFVLLAILAWARWPRPATPVRRVVHARANRIVREGLIAGVIGATSVALWFLIVDVIAGRPLFTPTLLGRALFSIFGPVPEGESAIVHVIAYTIFHYTAFIAVGSFVAYIVSVAETQPSVLAGLLILFVAFEIGFHAFVALLQETTALGALAWYQVMAGNLIAALLMGTYV